MKEDLKLRCSNCGNVLQDIRFKMITRSTGAVKNLCCFCAEEELMKLKKKIIKTIKKSLEPKL